MTPYARLGELLRTHPRAALVTVASVQGSTPRETDAFMIVTPDGDFSGTIGGGALEWRALAKAQAMLERGEVGPVAIDQALGPDLGQCCGGRMRLAIEVIDQSRLAEVEKRADGEIELLDPIVLFGAGHVGRALVLALAPLPFEVTWVDERPGAFPAIVPGRTRLDRGPALDALARAPDRAQVLIMTHSHALDLDLCAGALSTGRFASVGVIGSATKRARFTTRLTAMGFSREDIAMLRCPIGLPSLTGKAPAVIAASVVAEALLIGSRARAELATRLASV